MLDPLDFEKTPLVSLLNRRRMFAAIVLGLEIAGAALWRIISWIALFAGLWMLQIPAVFGAFGPAVAFVVFLAGLLYLLRADIKHLHWPQRHDVDRRLEQDSAMAHRPLSAIEDRLVNPRLEPTRKLWRKNQDDAYAIIRKLRFPLPRPVLPRKDPLALRMLAILVLVTGIVAAGPQWLERLAFGLFPFALDGQGEKVSPITLWITPPEYTAMPQVTLQGSGRRDDEMKVPEGSVLKIRVTDGYIQPVLVMGEKEVELEKLGDKSWGLETEIPPGERLVLKQWPMTRASIAYKYVADTPPQVTLNGEPEIMTKGEMQIGLKVLDDYGVKDLAMTMDLDPMIEDRPLGAPFAETRAVMSPPGTEQEIAPVYDLSWHPWSGMPVVVNFEGVDHKGQKSSVPPLMMTLPERPFSHPIAQKLIEQRRRLIWTPEHAAENVALDLESLLNDPAQFQNDIRVFLALRSASSRLAYNVQDRGSIVDVIELLWDTALRIEEGDLPLAARNLQDAQRNLEQVLNDPEATDEQIAQAMQELREAMGEYFQELFREMQKRMAEGGKQMPLSPEMMQNMIQPEDLASFLDQLQAEALSGNRDNARELLSQLQQFMDMLDPSMDMAMPPQMEFMMEGINEMQELIEKQQALKDQTQKQADRLSGAQPQKYPDFLPFDPQMQDLLKQWGMEKMPPPPQDNPQKDTPAPKANTQQNKVEQDALRYILGQLMLEADEQLGEIPEKMQMAEQEMRNSADQLGQNQPGPSIPHQDAAIQHLQDGMQEMAQKMQQMMQAMTMFSFGGPGQFDPLGRPMQEGDNPGFFPGSRVKIPEEAERKRVQEILKVLRQRSGEIHRPDYELEYYRRLMKQF